MTDEKVVTMYSIRYCESDGDIEICKAQVSEDRRYAFAGAGASLQAQRIGRDIFYSQEEARLAAFDKLSKSISSTEKRLARLRKLQGRFVELTK